MAGKESEVEGLERMFRNESEEPVELSYSVIESMTKQFCQMIGHGGFGNVYLGALGNDVMVAVKQLHPSLDHSDTQFMAEVKCLTGVNHENIVRFLGYCAYTHEIVMKVGDKDRMVSKEPKRFLCFEYATNGNLQDYLQGETHQWSIRYKIMKGICQGLHYLHVQKRITHLDLKPANVLLGAQLEPKITDFGSSRHGIQSTIVTSNRMGTLGYMAPEYIDEGKISFKSDIFSLGIIMIRLLMGNTNESTLGNWHKLVNVECQQMERCIEIARKCIEYDPNGRPNISEVISTLTKTETTIQIVPPVIIAEPRNDPTSRLYKNVKIFLARQYQREAKKPMERPKWKLLFKHPLKFPIFTGEKIEDANGNPLEVVLVDAETGEPSAFQKVLHLEFVPLLGNFPRDSWDADDFQRGVVVDLEAKHPLLSGGGRLITMCDRSATVNELMFMGDSRNCGCMFRIGVRVLPDSYQGARILEGMTEAFMVRDRNSDKWPTHIRPYNWQLEFQSQPRQPIYPGSNITDVIGNPLEIILVDMETGLPSALPMTMELDIELVPLISLDDTRLRMKPREGKGPLLSGDIRLAMKDNGRVTVNELQFTAPPDSINESGNKKVCIGVQVVRGSYHSHAGRILEGVTKAFEVQDNRTQKRFPPALTDEVWRLRHISWGGVFHERLTQNNVSNVQDFLQMLAVKPDELRAIMGDGMEKSAWKEITRHAKTCVFPIDKVHAYSTDQLTIYVNSVFDLVKVRFGFLECSLQKLDKARKKFVQKKILQAYEHRHRDDRHRIVQQTWKLVFKSQPPLKIDAGRRIVDATGNPLEIILVDAETRSPSALRMELHIQLVPLLGDFPPYEDWSTEEFQTAIVKPHQRKKNSEPILKGDVRSTMRDGRVTVNNIWFTDGSSWVRCCKFRIGACVVPGGNYDGSCRIVEAVTEAFVVEDLNQNHYPPVLDDPIWRLEGIDKDERFYGWLTSKNVDTVQEFLRMLNVGQLSKLYWIMQGIDYNAILRATLHAKTCDPGDKVYTYSGTNGTIYLDSVFGRLFKVEVDGVEYPLLLLQLDESIKILAVRLIWEAHENRHNLQEVGAAMEVRDNATIDIHELLIAILYNRTNEDNYYLHDNEDDHKNPFWQR